MNKIHAFAYIMLLFAQWYEKHTGRSMHSGLANNALSQLLALKLLFLASTLKRDEKDLESDLLGVFDNFFALPYGPVESDIYDAIKHNRVDGLKFEGVRTDIDESIVRSLLNEGDRSILQLHVEKLERINSDLVVMNPFDVVEITHKWKSWSINYEFAKFIGQQGYPMSVNEIRQDTNKTYGTHA